MIPFFKYQGTGNDFVMIDERESSYGLTKESIAQMCDRRFGIGADGLILLQKDILHDFSMVYHNADGGEGSLCGNGGRCTVKFAFDLGMITSKTTFKAIDGVHNAEVLLDGIVKLQMGAVNDIEEHNGMAFCDTGSPHVVSFVKEVDSFDVFNEGGKIRNSEYWLARNGTNVNFVELLNETTIKVRTFERGVEAETFSCGTGVTAAALVSNKDKGIQSPIKVETLGGDLKVHFSSSDIGRFNDIWLEGPAKKVFQGAF